MIRTKPPSKEYEEGWERVWGKEKERKEFSSKRTDKEIADWVDNWCAENPTVEEGE